MADIQTPVSGDKSAPPAPDPTPSVDELQFQRAEAMPGSASLQGCAACKKPILSTYYHAAGHVVCPSCAERIQLGTQSPPTSSLAKAALYGGGAALAGCILFATVSYVTGFQIGLISILVGFMVGKAIRTASGGLGGRPQQILAVALTYFAITTSYIPSFLSDLPSHRKAQAAGVEHSGPAETTPTPKRTAPSVAGFGAAVVILVAVFAAAPFFSLTSGSGLINLLIIFFGLSKAWKLTGKSRISIVGPYQLTAG